MVVVVAAVVELGLQDAAAAVDERESIADDDNRGRRHIVCGGVVARQSGVGCRRGPPCVFYVMLCLSARVC